MPARWPPPTSSSSKRERGLPCRRERKCSLSAILLTDLDSILVKRIALRQNITLTVRGIEIPLETNAKADAGGLARHFERLKAAA